MNYSIKDIKASYSSEKREKELRQCLLGYITYRQLSFVITLPFLKYSIPANSVTYLSLFFILALPFIALYGGTYAYIYIALFCFVYLCLDHIDGTIARVTKTSSRLGLYLDHLFGNLHWVLVYASIGILVDQKNPEFLLFANSGLCAGLVAGILDLLGKGSRLHFKLHFSSEKAHFSLTRKSQNKIIKTIAAAVPSAGLLIVPLLLITGYLDILYITLAFAFLLTLLMFVYSLIQIIIKLRKNEIKIDEYAGN